MIQKPRGTQDLFGHEAKTYATLENLLIEIFKNYNLTEFRTPIFEARELFVRSVGSTSDVVKKEMYEFTDKKGRTLVLRPEGTAPIVRAILENKLYDVSNLPLKVYYHGPMFRYERPQVGRNRQFEQMGVEFFGSDSVAQDLEVLGLTISILKTLKLEDKVQVDLNFLVTGKERKTYISALKKYFQTFNDLCTDCQARLKTNPLRVLDCKIDGQKFQTAPDMSTYLNVQDQTRFAQIVTGVKKFGIEPVLNPKLVRGLDYYTGLIFEVKYNSQVLGSQSTILAGGRYNQLVQELGGIDLPAIGFALGMERLIIVLGENQPGLILVPDEGLDLYTIALTPQAQALNQTLIFELRQAGMKVDTDYLGRSLKSAFKQAEKFQTQNIIVIGNQEVETQTVEVKNQAKKTTTKVAIAELGKFLREK